jgi:hypothetical protein
MMEEYACCLLLHASTIIVSLGWLTTSTGCLLLHASTIIVSRVADNINWLLIAACEHLHHTSTGCCQHELVAGFQPPKC